MAMSFVAENRTLSMIQTIQGGGGQGPRLPFFPKDSQKEAIQLSSWTEPIF